MTAAATFPVLRDGITDVPHGHVATIKSYLEMSLRPSIAVPAAPVGYRLDAISAPGAERYRAIFAELGQRWLWWSRLIPEPSTLADILANLGIQAFAVTHAGADIGLLELDFREPERPDLAFLGLLDGHTGRGIGAWLMAVALDALWRPEAQVVTVNTCTLDHPGAIAFYRRFGFRIVRQCIEVVPDPRRTGLLPASAAPHIPML